MISPGESAESVLKSQNTAEWWYLAPIALAIFMFLVMGTLFEHRIEALYRSVVERRQANLSQQTEVQQEVTVPPTNTAISTTPSQKSASIKVAPEKNETTIIIEAGKEKVTV